MTTNLNLPLKHMAKVAQEGYVWFLLKRPTSPYGLLDLPVIAHIECTKREKKGSKNVLEISLV